MDNSKHFSPEPETDESIRSEGGDKGSRPQTLEHFYPEPEGTPEIKDELLRSLAITRSKISKRNVVSYEVLAGKLSAEGLYSLLQPLVFDFWDKPLLFPFKIDSTSHLFLSHA